jgi:hypothetical protein
MTGPRLASRTRPRDVADRVKVRTAKARAIPEIESPNRDRVCPTKYVRKSQDHTDRCSPLTSGSSAAAGAGW